MGDTKQVKVDNWGSFFLQRLKHFFNRTDYCDLTLQFQDNAQLKVHRLVLNACTEYFELLERTCEMYEDCLIMPDDLQADVVVPIVNFMYTGQLEYKHELLNKLYQTAQIMNMSVLTKLLDAHRIPHSTPKPTVPKYKQLNNQSNYTRASSYKKSQPSTSQKRVYVSSNLNRTPAMQSRPGIYTPEPVLKSQQQTNQRKRKELPARPTRYEIPEELEKEDLFDNSFEDISYESKPLMTHPKNESTSKTSYVYEPSSSKRFDDMKNILKRPFVSTGDVEFKRLKTSAALFSDTEDYVQGIDDNVHIDRSRPQNQFDHVIEMEGAKVTIETKASNEKPIDHAKIISEVLKKYPHLVKNNKNIKLKIVNTPAKNDNKSTLTRVKSQSKRSVSPITEKVIKQEKQRDFTYETDIIDTKEVGRLIALGVENVKGPWLCLICGTPGKAINFSTYHKFRNHLVDVHNERPPSNMCEYCGLKSGKRNHLLHHIYTKHGVAPPPSYHFPKCNQCPYIALTQAFLVKHKMTHNEIRNFICNVCQCTFRSTNQLLEHIQQTGHKICPDRKANLQCIYCMKTFLRENNLYAHLKSNHKVLARNDGIIDYSDDEEIEPFVKSEPYSMEESVHEDDDIDDEEQYQINAETGSIQIINKKCIKSPNQKILNQNLLNQSNVYSTPAKKPEPVIPKSQLSSKLFQRNETSVISPNLNERIVVLNQNECTENEYIISDVNDEIQPQQILTNDDAFDNIDTDNQAKMQTNLTHKQNAIHPPYQIVVSSEQEYRALLAGNPSIIFQDSTEGKEMTAINRTDEQIEAANIDLDGTQNSNMMIIQQHYPINVSESLAGENSNIVVVYSHNINSQEGIEYSEQLVDDRNVAEQLVPSSQVLTTISNSIIEPTMMVQQPIQEWQNEEVVETVMQPPEHIVSDLPVDHADLIETENVSCSSTIADKDLTEETEIQIIHQTEGIINEIITTQSSDLVLDTVTVSQTGMLFNKETQEQNEVVQMDSVPTSAHSHKSSSVSLQDQTAPIIEVENIEIAPIETFDATISSVEENISEIPSNEENIDASIESENSQDAAEHVADILPSQSERVKECIEDLAAEWSDEETTKAQDVNRNVSVILTDQTVEKTESFPNENTTIAENSELEESIENIQAEVDSQLSVSNSNKRIIVTSDITLPNTAAIITKTRSLSNDNAELDQKKLAMEESSSNSKLSTILNDWDDNDSQSESNGINTPEKIETSVPSEHNENKQEPENFESDKTKSLDNIINDWDDDEEVKQ